MSTPTVVVTGLGAVCAFGWGVEPLREGLLSGATAIRPTLVLDTARQRTHLAAEVPPPPPGAAGAVAGWPHLACADRFALAAAVEACADAGLDPAGPDTGVYFGGSTAGMAEAELWFNRVIGAVPGAPRLRLLASQQINSPGDAVARHLGVAGPVQTVSSACASGGLAVAAALDVLRAGEVEVALAGGADALCQLTYTGFNSLRSVDSEPCRPFRGDRAGLSLGEGAGVLVLETLAHARARGARVLAELCGAGASCDAHHMTAPHPDGEGAALAINRALADAGLDPGEVSFINAHGTGTPHNDAAEARAVISVFGSRSGSIPITSTKGAVGHLLGCSGALEAVAAVLSVSDRLVQPTAGGGSVADDIPLDVVMGRPRPLSGRAVGVSTSFAFGGANAALVIGPPPADGP